MLLLEQLKQIPDHRGRQGQKYPLWILMALVIIGTFCGHVGYRPLGSFCQKYREQLWKLLEIEESLPCPSYSTLRRTLYLGSARALGNGVQCLGFSYLTPPRESLCVNRREKHQMYE